MMQLDPHIFKGIKRGVHPIRQDAEFLWDARNIRIMSDEDNHTLAITNEKSTIPLYSLGEEKYIGHTVLGNYLVLFSTITEDDSTEESIISRIDLDSFTRVILIKDRTLNFNVKHPIEAIISEENELIQKVYWTDAVNSPCFINIKQPELILGTDTVNSLIEEAIKTNTIVDFSKPISINGTNKQIYFPNMLKFIPELKLTEKVSVEEIGGAGLFPAGVLQYAFTYVSKYGQESNIFYTSPLIYTYNYNRGGSPEDSIPTSFKITVDNIEQEEFTYVRIYSIMRTSWNTTPTVKRIKDAVISRSSVTVVDNNTDGESIDPTLLLYIGGHDIIAGCICSKDNTLLLGNITINNPDVDSINIGSTPIKNFIREDWCGDDDWMSVFIGTDTRQVKLASLEDPTKNFEYHNQLSFQTSTFKKDETYRLGIQFQYKTGEWSTPMFLNDITVDTKGKSYPSLDFDRILYLNRFSLPLSNSNRYIADSSHLSPNGNKLMQLGFINPDGSAKTEDSDYIIRCRKLVNALLDNGYYKVRPVVVFPDIDDRNVLCQGLLCPTIFNRLQNEISNITEIKPENKSLKVQSSWIFRPYTRLENHEQGTSWDKNSGHYAIFSRDAEINNLESPNAIYDYKRLTDTSESLDPYTTKPFSVKYEVLTMHSPEIEFDESLRVYLNNASSKGQLLKLKLTGISCITNTASDVDIQVDSPNYNSRISGVNTPVVRQFYGGKGLLGGTWFRDCPVKVDDTGSPKLYDISDVEEEDFKVPMWAYSGSLNNDINRGDGSTRTGLLKTKVISNLRWAKMNVFFNNPLIYDIKERGLGVFSSNETELLKLSNNNIFSFYEGNVDYMYAGYGLKYLPEGKTNRRPVTDPVRIKYKSTPHIVLSNLECKVKKDGMSNEVTLNTVPLVKNYEVANVASSDSNKSFILDLHDHLKIKDIPGIDDYPDFIWFAEIIQDVDERLRFGGTSEEALQANLWFPAGETVDLRDFKYGGIDISWEWGDTWYQRYDCLKTYPFTNNDENQIVEICSFLCETRVNIDGRYDTNRGQLSNINMSPINFNKINKVYSQPNNFFNYRILDKDYYKIKNYSGQVLWSKTKVPASITDDWTNITLANSLDLDSSKGKLTAIKDLGDTLYAFQEHSVSQLMFNSRVQINTSDGVPIEIANSSKMDTPRLLVDNIGCTNKFSIDKSSSTLYFADPNTGCLYGIKDSFGNITADSGIKDWNLHDILKAPWTFEGNGGIRTFCDSRKGDVYFIPDNYEVRALQYAELTGYFQSTFDYNGSVMFTYGNSLYAFATDYNDKELKIWKVNPLEGASYNNIFGKYRGFDISFISNKAPEATKIFDTIELEADVFNYNLYQGDNSINPPFRYIDIENEYQHGLVELKDDEESNPYFKKKFRIWRALIPRNKGTRQRILNPWIKIKLGKTDSQVKNRKDESKTILHTAIVKFTV